MQVGFLGKIALRDLIRRAAVCGRDVQRDAILPAFGELVQQAQRLADGDWPTVQLSGLLKRRDQAGGNINPALGVRCLCSTKS